MASLFDRFPGIGPSLVLLLMLPIFRYVLYPALLSPLSKIPNAHPLAPWTRLWILRTRFKGEENRILYTKHRQLGPVIRLGPSEVSVNSYNDGLRLIYGGNFDKHQWYANVFANYATVKSPGIPNTFCIKEEKPHRERKRLFANIYSKSWLQSSKEIKDISKELVLNRIMPVFQREAENDAPIEVLEFGAAIGMDFTCAFLFGLDAGSDFIRDVPTRKDWLNAYEETKRYFTWVAELIIPVITAKLCGINILPNSVFETLHNMGIWNLKMCTAVEEAFSSGQQAGTTRAIVYEQMAAGMAKVDVKNLSHPKNMIIASEMLDQILAGHETTAITLTYLMYELSRNPALQSRLREEVGSLSPRLDYPGTQELPNPKEVDALPLLDALLQETLRRWPSAAGCEPRVTPSNGISLPDSKYHIPGGTRISCNQYTVHRNTEVFPDPEAFRPERWLNATKEQRNEMNKWSWAFGSGARMCLGMHFATQEIKFVVAALYTNYETKLVDGQNYDEDMLPLNGFVGRPKGNKCLIKFRRVD